MSIARYAISRLTMMSARRLPLVLLMVIALVLCPRLSSAQGLESDLGFSSEQPIPFFALTWSEFDNNAISGFDHLVPMVQAGGVRVRRTGEQIWKANRWRPEGRRSLVITWPHDYVWGHPDDRVRDANGNIIGRSGIEPGDQQMFRGGDAGYSSPWLDNFTQLAQEWTERLMREYVAEGGTLDYVIFDVESKLDEFKVSSSWRAALMADPRWPQAQARLNELKRWRTGNPNAVFDFSRGFDDDQENDWNAYMWEQQAKALNEGIFNVIKRYFPHLKGSNYEHHGREPGSGAVDLNTHPYYQTIVTGTHASDYYYGWLNQAEPQYGGSGFDILKYEQQRARASLRAGYRLQPWIAYDGFDDSDWDDVYNSKKGYDSSPYWAENLRHLLLLGADPVLYWNSRSYDDRSGTSGSNARDALVNSILEEVNETVALDAPRYPVTAKKLEWDVASGSDMVVTGLRFGNKVLWRVTVQRVGGESPELKIPVRMGSTPTGDVVTIPAGEVGAFYVSRWYEGIQDDLRFDFQHPSVSNLISGDDDFGLETWTVGANGTLKGGVKDPFGSARAYRLIDDLIVSKEIPVEPNTIYTVSIYAKHPSSSSVFNTNMAVLGADGTKEIGRAGIRLRGGQDWTRWKATFNSGNNRSVRIRFGQTHKSFDAHVFGPMLNKGAAAAPFSLDPSVGAATPDSPSSPATGMIQRIQLEQGCTLIASRFQLADSRLESVFGEVASAIIEVVDDQGRMYSPRRGINEIGTWKSGEAYSVCAERPVSFDLTGTEAVPQGIEIDLKEGWNLVPYLGNHPLSPREAFASAAPFIVLVTSDSGKVYYPSENVDTLEVLEPGEGYRLYANGPGTLVYPVN